MKRRNTSRISRLMLVGLALVIAGGVLDAAEQGAQADRTIAPAATAALPPAPSGESPGVTTTTDRTATPPTGAAQSGLTGTGAQGAPQTSAVTLYMPDGQLRSRRLSVYVTATVLLDHKPRLRLFRGHAITEAAAGEDEPLEPTLVAPGQQWTETVDGQDVTRAGTILLFDGSQMPFGPKAMVRVRPALTWTDGGVERTVLGSREVNVGNIVYAVVWTMTVVGVSLLGVIALAWRRGSSPMLFLTGVDGHLSLAQAQVACWTVFVGSVVLGYGLIRLEIPEIPESLLVLMGASLVTGGMAYFQDAKKVREAQGIGRAPVARVWSLGDLVRVFSPGQPPELSLAKAQMLFWTILLLVLFVSKSIMEGRIWEVPWPLVALMGFSQAGYLATKSSPGVQSGNQAATPPVPPSAGGEAAASPPPAAQMPPVPPPPAPVTPPAPSVVTPALPPDAAGV